MPAVFVSSAIAVLHLSVALAADSDLEQIKTELKAQVDAEMNAMKEKYEKRIEGLEKRIGTLESDNARLKHEKAATASSHAESSDVEALRQRISHLEQSTPAPSTEATPPPRLTAANEAQIEAIEAKLRADLTEERDIHRDDANWPFDVTKLYDLARPFEFHGYMRSGFGLNGEGGKMEAFKAPGAGAKYRLGNESDTYGEIGLTNNWLRADDISKAPYVRTTAMLSYSTAENFSFDSLNNQAQGNDIALRQAFVEAGNVFQSEPDIRFWAGQRYYMRHDIHINDFYYLDMSGYGGGVEALPLGKFGKLALAWLGGSVDNYATDHGNTAKQNFDLRIYDIDVLAGKLTFWFDYAHTRGGDVRNVFDPEGEPFSVQSSSGWAIGLIHRTNEKKPEEPAPDPTGKTVYTRTENQAGGSVWFPGGYNDFSIQYGSGAAYNFQSTLDTSGPNLDDAWRFRVTDHFTIQPVPEFAMQAVGLYEETEFGGPNSHQRWASVGARPVFFFSDRFSIALEFGVDWAKSEPLGTNGHLWKITLAPQISRGGKFFSRPVIRPFVTYSQWSDDFKGLVGGTPYQNATDGLSYGIQAEAWW